MASALPRPGLSRGRNSERAASADARQTAIAKLGFLREPSEPHYDPASIREGNTHTPEFQSHPVDMGES